MSLHSPGNLHLHAFQGRWPDFQHEYWSLMLIFHSWFNTDMMEWRQNTYSDLHQSCCLNIDGPAVCLY